MLDVHCHCLPKSNDPKVQPHRKILSRPSM
jgi:hypothetical protein